MLIQLRRRLHVVLVARLHKSLSGNTGQTESVNMSLPAELWAYIAEFLDIKDLSRLYLVNRAFYSAFLAINYRTIRICNTYWKKDAVQEAVMLVALRNPEISRNVRSLSISTYFVDLFIRALTRSQKRWQFPMSARSCSLPAYFPDPRKSREAFEQAVQDSLSMLPNLTNLDIDLHKHRPAILDTLWTSYSWKLVSLTLNLCHRLQIPSHTFGLGIPCPRLRSLHVTVSTATPYSELLPDLRRLIPEDGGCMEELSISLRKEQPFLINANLGFLRKIYLGGEHTTTILPFIAPHRDTLREISLAKIASKDLRCLLLLNASILTCLTLFAGPLIEHQHVMFPFLSQCLCLHSLVVLHGWLHHLGEQSSVNQIPLFTNLLHSLPASLTHLVFPGVILDFKLFLSISQHLPNISYLHLSECYPANEEIEAHFSMIIGRTFPDLPGMLGFRHLQTPLKAFTAREDLNESNQEALFKLFLGCLTHLGSCCLTYREL